MYFSIGEIRIPHITQNTSHCITQDTSHLSDQRGSTLCTCLQVRERRQARDEKKKKEVRQQQREKEAWQEAERLVREGEREEGRRRRREEAMVAEQMTAIRRQVQEETERKRRYIFYLPNVQYHCSSKALINTCKDTWKDKHVSQQQNRATHFQSLNDLTHILGCILCDELLRQLCCACVYEVHV